MPLGIGLFALKRTKLHRKYDYPEDWTSSAFAEGLQERRKEFGPDERTAFNHMVCDELAARGESPNSANVLKCGRWGATAAVAADVRSWHRIVGRERAARQPAIPDGARRQANDLLEQIWSIACLTVREPLDLEIKRLRDELAASQQDVADGKALVAQLHAANERFVAQARTAESELTVAATALAKLREQTDAQIAEFNRSIAQCTVEHANELRSQQEKHSAAQDAAATAHAQVVADLNARIARLEQDAHDVRRQSAMEVDRARQATIETSRQAEQARSDARAAAERADKALAAAEDRASGALAQERAAKERQSQAEAAAQRAVGELGQARQEIERLGQLLMEAQDALAKSRGRGAAADRKKL